MTGGNRQRCRFLVFVADWLEVWPGRWGLMNRSVKNGNLPRFQMGLQRDMKVLVMVFILRKVILDDLRNSRWRGCPRLWIDLRLIDEDRNRRNRRNRRSKLGNHRMRVTVGAQTGCIVGWVLRKNEHQGELWAKKSGRRTGSGATGGFAGTVSSSSSNGPSSAGKYNTLSFCW